MQTLLTSPIDSSSRSGKTLSTRGFTLIELLVSTGIIVMITSIVLVRYDHFDSTVLLKNVAYDIALALREAQIKSVSAVRGNAAEADFPYGVTFTPGTASSGGKEYVTFRYSSAVGDPEYDVTDASPKASRIGTSTIDRTMYITDVCVTDSGGEDCSINRLDVSFRRPEFRALFYADGYGGSMSNISKARILVGSPKGSEVFEVHISRLGQISVVKQ